MKLERSGHELFGRESGFRETQTQSGKIPHLRIAPDPHARVREFRRQETPGLSRRRANDLIERKIENEFLDTGRRSGPQYLTRRRIRELSVTERERKFFLSGFLTP